MHGVPWVCHIISTSALEWWIERGRLLVFVRLFLDSVFRHILSLSTFHMLSICGDPSVRRIIELRYKTYDLSILKKEEAVRPESTWKPSDVM